MYNIFFVLLSIRFPQKNLSVTLLNLEQHIFDQLGSIP